VGEQQLYPPVEAFLEGQGYAVKGEVNGCDLVAVRGEEPPLIVELKTSFSLPLVFQGVARQALSDNVYLAVPPFSGRTNRKKDALGLCRRLGLGLLMVLAPLSYRGMGTSGDAPKVACFIVSGLMTWATFAILYLAAIMVPPLIGSLSLVPTMIIDAGLVLALVGAAMHSARCLTAAVSGDGAAAWHLP